MENKIDRRTALKLLLFGSAAVVTGCRQLENQPTENPNTQPTSTPEPRPVILSAQEIAKPTPQPTQKSPETDPTPEIPTAVYTDNGQTCLNQQWNLLQATRYLTKSMLDRPIHAHDGQFSLLERTNALYNFELANLYKLSWGEGGDTYLTLAGGALDFSTAIAHVFAQVDHLPNYDQIEAQAFFDPYNKNTQRDLQWTNQTDQDLWLIPQVEISFNGNFPRWWSATTAPSPLKLNVSIHASSQPPTAEDQQIIEDRLLWLDSYLKNRPNAVEYPTEKPYRLEAGPSFFNQAEVDRMYEIDGGLKITDLEVDPKIMQVVKNLNPQASGDITNLLIRTIPTDNAKKLGYSNSVGMRFSDQYYPHWPLVIASKFGVQTFQGHENLYLDSDATQALISLQSDLQKLGLNAYLTYGYRDYEEQWIMNKATPEGGAGSPGASEHVTGLVADLYTKPSEFQYPDYQIQALANQHGFVSSLSLEGDAPHFFYLDGVWPGLTQALLAAGLDPNERYTSVQTRLAIFQILVAHVH